jgi:DNA-binding CsgD family transcriptional regulator
MRVRDRPQDRSTERRPIQRQESIQGAALSIEDAIAYVQRGRGKRKRPSSGWASLTPTELDVARLVSEGLANKQIATQLFVSPRTVQTHLTHIYTKLGITSRVQLAQEAARHTRRTSIRHEPRARLVESRRLDAWIR